MNKLIFVIPFILLVGFFSCKNNNAKQVENKPIELYLEESFKPLFETSIYTFSSQNNRANLSANYVSEADAIDAFLEGKTSTICITRDFTEQEKKSLRANKNIEVRSTKMAIDAVALIVHPQNSDTLMTLDRVKKIIRGEDTLWTGTNKRINVVFDNPNSANFLYLKRLSELEGLPSNVFAVNSNEEVINYVKDNKNALGIIGVNWISDEDDPTTLNFLDGINVVEVAKSLGEEYYKPYQAYIYEEYYDNRGYPLVREAWLLNKASRTSMNASFVNFMIGEKGQLIIQKSSLIPANMVARMINFTTD